MDLCKGGELTDVLTERSLKEEETADILKTVLDALKYCH